MMSADQLLALQWAGAVVGLVGAFLLALNTSVSRWGWLAFLGSNILILLFTGSVGLWGFFTMQVGFTATSVLGLWRASVPQAPPSTLTQEAVDQWLLERGKVAVDSPPAPHVATAACPGSTCSHIRLRSAP